MQQPQAARLGPTLIARTMYYQTWSNKLFASSTRDVIPLPLVHYRNAMAHMCAYIKFRVCFVCSFTTLLPGALSAQTRTLSSSPRRSIPFATWHRCTCLLRDASLRVTSTLRKGSDEG